MSDNEFRLFGSKVVFDKQKDKDIIERAAQLRSQHRLGEYVAHLLRLALKDEDIFNQFIEKKGVLGEMTKLGTLPATDAFFKDIQSQINELKRKIDAIYDISMKVYTLAQFGKRIGIEEKADNILRAQFLLQLQTEELARELGVNNLNHTYVSNKIEESHEKADKTLEYILESYDNIISELKQQLKPEIVTVSLPVQVPVIQEVKAVNMSTKNKEITDNTDAKKGEAVESSKIVEVDETDEDENIDFGMDFDKHADISALSNFFGESG